MKNNRKEEKQSVKSSNSGKRIWKTVAIAVVVIFVLVIIGGIIKAYYIRSSFAKPTQAQIDYATKIATDKLKSTGVNTSVFQVHAGNRMRKFHEDGTAKTIIQVMFSNNTTSHTYLVDLNNGEMLLHSETEVYGSWINPENSNRRDPWYSFYPRLPNHRDSK